MGARLSSIEQCRNCRDEEATVICSLIILFAFPTSEGGVISLSVQTLGSSSNLCACGPEVAWRPSGTTSKMTQMVVVALFHTTLARSPDNRQSVLRLSSQTMPNNLPHTIQPLPFVSFTIGRHLQTKSLNENVSYRRFAFSDIVLGKRKNGELLVYYVIIRSTMGRSNAVTHILVLLQCAHAIEAYGSSVLHFSHCMRR